MAEPAHDSNKKAKKPSEYQARGDRYQGTLEEDKGMKSQPPLLRTGEMLRNRFVVDVMIGGGGFGQIFR